MLKGECLCGSVTWQLREMPESATACNCTACRRYGVLWAYGFADEDVLVAGKTTSFIRGKALSFDFCPQCGCIASWTGLQVNEEGKRRQAVNLRLAEPEPIAHLPIDHFDGLDTWDDLPRDSRCIKDMWF